MKIEKTELEFDEIYKGKVKPIATGGYIPFFKKFIGRIVHIILPRNEKVFWLFKKEDLEILKRSVNKIEFKDPYSKQRKEEVIDAINKISKNQNEFEIENLIKIVDNFEGKKLDNHSKNLIIKIKKLYSI